MIDIRLMYRWSATTRTWFAKTVGLMLAHAEEATTEEQRWAVGYDAERLLDAVLDDAEQLVALLNDDALDDVSRKAKALASALRARVLVLKLENVEGRGEAETASFMEKAAELRRQSR